MHQSQNIKDNASNSEWTIQSEYWIDKLAKLQKPRKLRERNPNTLILSGHGNSMRIDRGTLLIKEGFSHYPQKAIEHRYFKGDLELPKTIMLLDGSGSLSFDVLSWLSEQNISLIRIKWNGELAMVLSSTGYTADQNKVDWQRTMRDCPEKQIAFASQLISNKLANAIPVLENEIPNSQLQQKAIARTKCGIAQLSKKLSDMQQIRAIEGECASLYFKSWSKLQLHWRQSVKYPIPDNWFNYRARSAVRSQKPANHGATDPVNAILNYAYAVLQAQLQLKVIGEGYDPAIGIMHNGRRGKPAYIFDLIEPLRPKADAIILNFVQNQKLSPADFILRRDGVCRLSPGLARMVSAMLLSDLK